MNAAELAVLKEQLHEEADKVLPDLIAAEEARLPAAFQGVAKMVVDSLYPKLQAALDAKIDSLGAAAAAAPAAAPAPAAPKA